MKSFRKKMGKRFVAGGWGRSGPYLVATHRLANGTYAKATTGTRGTTVGVKQRIGRRNLEIGYNLTTKSAYLRQSRARRRSRT
jgi:hypothetical protein